jgi:hypothetical protein
VIVYQNTPDLSGGNHALILCGGRHSSTSIRPERFAMWRQSAKARLKPAVAYTFK